VSPRWRKRCVSRRTSNDRFVNTANPFVLVPESQTLSITHLFAQDTIALRADVKLTVGVKLEYSTFTQWAVMPSARVGANFLWAAISRAVRPPSRIERDLMAPGIVNTSPDFQSEKLIAYEAGWRSQLAPQATFSLALFYNDYSDLRTTSPNPQTVLPVTFGNGLAGYTYGLDAWGTWTPLRWLRISRGVELLRKDFHLQPGERDIAGIQCSATIPGTRCSCALTSIFRTTGISTSACARSAACPTSACPRISRRT
jgi:iron complex outermembrane receptor protein